jgi:hypothetical protein
MFVLGGLIVAVFLNGGCDKQNEIQSHSDTLYIPQPPVVNNYTFTQPTVYKERTIVYDSTKPTLTRSDSDAIVLDYLKEREYTDSILKDSSKVVYNAKVAKNHLIDIRIRQSYTPAPAMRIIETQILNPNAIIAGSEFSYYMNSKLPSFAPVVGFETPKFSYMGKYDFLQKQAAITIARRFTKRNTTKKKGR